MVRLLYPAPAACTQPLECLLAQVKIPAPESCTVAVQVVEDDLEGECSARCACCSCCAVTMTSLGRAIYLLMSDGALRTANHYSPSWRQAVHFFGGASGPMYPAVVLSAVFVDRDAVIQASLEERRALATEDGTDAPGEEAAAAEAEGATAGSEAGGGTGGEPGDVRQLRRLLASVGDARHKLPARVRARKGRALWLGRGAYLGACLSTWEAPVAGDYRTWLCM